jgi:hypothetical protein
MAIALFCLFAMLCAFWNAFGTWMGRVQTPAWLVGLLWFTVAISSLGGLVRSLSNIDACNVKETR